MADVLKKSLDAIVSDDSVASIAGLSKKLSQLGSQIETQLAQGDGSVSRSLLELMEKQLLQANIDTRTGKLAEKIKAFAAVVNEEINSINKAVDETKDTLDDIKKGVSKKKKKKNKKNANTSSIPTGTENFSYKGQEKVPWYKKIFSTVKKSLGNLPSSGLVGAAAAVGLLSTAWIPRYGENTKSWFKELGPRFSKFMNGIFDSAKRSIVSFTNEYIKPNVPDWIWPKGKVDADPSKNTPRHLPSLDVSEDLQSALKRGKPLSYKQAYDFLSPYFEITSTHERSTGIPEDGSSRASSRTCLDQIKPSTVAAAIHIAKFIKSDCNCNEKPYITGGTERGHSQAHKNGEKFDMRVTDSAGSAFAKKLQLKKGDATTRYFGGYTCKIYRHGPHDHLDIHVV